MTASRPRCYYEQKDINGIRFRSGGWMIRGGVSLYRRCPQARARHRLAAAVDRGCRLLVAPALARGVRATVAATETRRR